MSKKKKKEYVYFGQDIFPGSPGWKCEKNTWEKFCDKFDNDPERIAHVFCMMLDAAFMAEAKSRAGENKRKKTK